jgi:putative hydrolase
MNPVPDYDPGDSPNPLQGLLGDLLKVIGGAGARGTAWLEAARALAHSVATDGAPEPNADPLQRIRLEELARVAELRVTDATGLSLGPSGPPALTPVGRGTWAMRVLESWRPLVEGMVRAQEAAAGTGLAGMAGFGAAGLPPLPGLSGSDEDEDEGGLQALLGRFYMTMGPVLLGMQFGSAAGHLAQRALGQYALPIPWPPSDELLIVPENIAVFADDWSLPVDQTELWVCVRELTTHAVMSQPHVSARFAELLEASTLQAVAVQGDLAERFGENAGNPEALQSLLSDPEALLADLLTPGQRATSAQLTALATALGGYVDHMTAQVGQALTGTSGTLAEAWYRYRVADAKGEQAAGALFGLDLGRDQVDRGATFVRGIIERAGDDGLAKLWAAPRNLPTPPEVDAPGLWLERISLPDEDEPGPPPSLPG